MTNPTQSKQQAQTAVARAQQLRRQDERPVARPQYTYRDPDQGRITLDAFENKYYPKVEVPVPAPSPSRWELFGESLKTVGIQMKEAIVHSWSALSKRVGSSLSATGQKLGLFFTSLKDTYNTWREKQREEPPVSSSPKMKDGYYDVPVVEDERYDDSDVAEQIAKYVSEKISQPTQKVVCKLYLGHADRSHAAPAPREPGRPIKRYKYAFER